MTLHVSDLERRSVWGQNFLADVHDYAWTAWSRMTKFGVVTQVGEQHISSGSAVPTSQGAGPQPPYLSRNGLTYSDKIWSGNTCGGVACFRGSRPHSRGRGPRAPNFLEPSTYSEATDLTYSDETWYGNTCHSRPYSKGAKPQRPRDLFGPTTYAQTVWRLTYSYSDETLYDNTCFLGVSHVPVPRGGPSVPPKRFGTCAHRMRNGNFFPRWSNWTWGKVLHGRPRMLICSW